MASTNEEIKVGSLNRVMGWFKGVIEKLRSNIVYYARMAKKLGEDDPRRIIHSLKVGLAITIVSLLYYFDPLFDGFGISAIWAVITVIVVLEFSVGATLGRGLNRGFATFLAGALGVGAHRLASFSGETCEPILLGLFVFIIAAMVTFIRFFPKMKARYDYGLLIFILTFCLISVSGYRDDEVLDMAHKRLSTILIGGATAVIVCICICPVWAGTDLHNQVATNLDKLGNFLEGFGGEYFTKSEGKESKDNKSSSMQAYKSVLNTKSTEESLVNFAKWEPGHGQFRYRHPWNQYLKIGVLTRQCAYTIEALNNYLNYDIQTPLEIGEKIKESCTKMSSESSLALKELATAIRGMTQPSKAKTHIANAIVAAKNLKSIIQTGPWKDTDLFEIIPATTVASLLVDIVICTEKIGKSVHELASFARFKSSESESKLNKQETEKPCFGIEGPHHVISIHGSSTVLPENCNHQFSSSGGE